MKDTSDATKSRRIAIAIHAMGGQGGGVLVDWLEKLALANGYAAQATSVPGVAQRTGATVYYVEMLAADGTDNQPVLALMPTPGDVDVVIAAELMEAGRAIQRGFVTPERTTLIASTHRSFAMTEKQQPGDGIADGSKVLAAIAVAARKSMLADYAGLAETRGSVISAALFGAVFASGALPFSRANFEDAIKSGGVGVAASLATFAAATEAAGDMASAKTFSGGEKSLPLPPSAVGQPLLDALLARLRSEFPVATHPMIYVGIKHLVDFQDPAYAGEYLDRLKTVLAVDAAAHGYRLTTEAARQLARAMAYDDVIRVADLKTRQARSRRVEREVGVRQADVLQTTEFFHPRMEEVCGMLPAWLGAAIERRPRLFKALNAVVDRGRRVRTDTISGHLQLTLIARRRSNRRGTLRHEREMKHVGTWLARVVSAAPANFEFAIELARCRRLVKGYSDTMARGLSKFDRVVAGAGVVEQRPDAADWVRRLRQAALLDEEGLALDGALKTIATLDPTPVADKKVVA